MSAIERSAYVLPWVISAVTCALVAVAASAIIIQSERVAIRQGFSEQFQSLPEVYRALAKQGSTLQTHRRCRRHPTARVLRESRKRLCGERQGGHAIPVNGPLKEILPATLYESAAFAWPWTPRRFLIFAMVALRTMEFHRPPCARSRDNRPALSERRRSIRDRRHDTGRKVRFANTSLSQVRPAAPRLRAQSIPWRLHFSEVSLVHRHLSGR